MENPPKARRVWNPQSPGAGASSHRGDRGHRMSSKPNGKGRKLPFPQDTCYRCGKGRHQKVQDCKAVDTTCRGCGKKGHFEKVCLKKHSTNSLEVPQASTSTAGAGASGEPLYFDDGGQPVYIVYGQCPPCEQTFDQVSDSIGLYHTQGQEQNGKFHQIYCMFHTVSVAQGRHRGWCKLDEQKNIRSTLWRGQRSTSTDTYQDGKLWKYCSESARDVPCISEVEGQGLQTIILHDRLWQIP